MENRNTIKAKDYKDVVMGTGWQTLPTTLSPLICYLFFYTFSNVFIHTLSPSLSHTDIFTVFLPPTLFKARVDIVLVSSGKNPIITFEHIVIQVV